MKPQIRLHDTQSREVRPLEPADPKRITMYVCGPTVYDRPHIGNARPAVVFDVLARLIRHIHGEDSLVYARNVTDVDDKINAAAAAESVPIDVIARRNEALYLEDMAALGVEPPTMAPHATESIPAIIEFIRDLIRNGHAYEAEGHVLFHVPSDPGYGRLSHRPREEMIAGARVEVAPYKRDPADFVLWKPSTPDLPGWDSPWGRGRPGWHIECSAMILEHLGRTIDIHGGGLDLVFPHHENEAAQSVSAHGVPLARHWVHNGFLSIDEAKMSKSLGNILTVGELLEQGVPGEVIRLALLSAHYRQPLNWSDALVRQSKNTLDRWYRARERLEQAGLDDFDHPPDPAVVEALADDLNTPKAIAEISALLARAFDLPAGHLHSFDTASPDFRNAAAALAGFKAAQLLGLLSQPAADWFQGSAPEDVARIEEAIAARLAARRERNFAEADRIRDELAAEGIILEDGPDGTTWRRA